VVKLRIEATVPSAYPESRLKELHGPSFGGIPFAPDDSQLTQGDGRYTQDDGAASRQPRPDGAPPFGRGSQPSPSVILGMFQLNAII
jgi:hypothetical protein